MERLTLGKESMNRDNPQLLGITPSNFNVTCSWCGALIRTNAAADAEQMCLICHARMLNDYFHRVKKLDGGDNGHSRRRR
jgi:hypothetical protein